jgi:hypothetical protein
MGGSWAYAHAAQHDTHHCDHSASYLGHITDDFARRLVARAAGDDEASVTPMFSLSHTRFDEAWRRLGCSLESETTFPVTFQDRTISVTLHRSVFRTRAERDWR